MIQRANAKKPHVRKCLVPLPKVQWPEGWEKTNPSLIEIWKSPLYQVQIYAILRDLNDQAHWPIERLTITTANQNRRVSRLIHRMPFDMLFKLKVECGRGMYFSMEPMPAYDQEISIPNARHLLIYSVKPDYL